MPQRIQGRTAVNRVTSSDGTTIAFDRSGDGPAIILVGGAIQHRAIDERTTELAALLAPRFTVVHYDRRGRGDSRDTPPYAVEREVDDIAALIDDAGGSASLFGMSSGAVLALDAAARGLAVAKLALYEPPFIVDDSRPPLPADYVERLTEMTSTGRPGDAVAYFMTVGMGMPEGAVAPMRDAPFWPALESVANTLAYDGTIMQGTMRREPLPVTRWASVTVPALVLDGGDSPAYQRNAVRALADLLPGAQRRTLEGQTHEVDPALLAPVLEKFFA
jgi:pimeloyl-ACP methyl ester carboxylesterase